MHNTIVHSPKELRAAISAMACATKAEAAKAPFAVHFETCVYTFPAGVTETRAREIGKRIASIYFPRKKKHA